MIDSIDYDSLMALAIKEAERSSESEDIPIGCIIVHENRIIGRAHNQIELLKDATAHAEMIAITQAESELGDWRLNDCTLIVTKEPCPMCAGAILLSRIGMVVYGVPAPRDGAVGSAINILNNPALGSSVKCIGGVLEEECRWLLQDFFQRVRKKPKREKELRVDEREGC
jgi:tRNA(adenine34) deaminase